MVDGALCPELIGGMNILMDGALPLLELCERVHSPRCSVQSVIWRCLCVKKKGDRKAIGRAGLSVYARVSIYASIQRSQVKPYMNWIAT